MSNYIRAPARLMRQAQRFLSTSEADIQNALHVLSESPVPGYAPFTEIEVRLVAAYRVALYQRGYEFVWPVIVRGEPEAWCFALHEIKEIEEFARKGVNPFDRAAWRRNYKEAHFRACIYELQYLKKWAIQIGIEVSEMALECEHPWRLNSLGQMELLSWLK